jgi:hypothetical protein
VGCRGGGVPGRWGAGVVGCRGGGVPGWWGARAGRGVVPDQQLAYRGAHLPKASTNAWASSLRARGRPTRMHACTHARMHAPVTTFTAPPDDALGVAATEDLRTTLLLDTAGHCWTPHLAQAARHGGHSRSAVSSPLHPSPPAATVCLICATTALFSARRPDRAGPIGSAGASSARRGAAARGAACAH